MLLVLWRNSNVAIGNAATTVVVAVVDSAVRRLGTLRRRHHDVVRVRLESIDVEQLFVLQFRSQARDVASAEVFA